MAMTVPFSIGDKLTVRRVIKSSCVIFVMVFEAMIVMEKRKKGQPTKEVKKKQIYFGVRQDIIDKVGNEKKVKLICVEYLERMTQIKNK